MAKGKKAIVIREGDRLIGVELTDGNSEILLANRNGRAIRFHESKLRSMGRVSTGVRGMKLDGGDDAVIGLIAMNAETDNNVMVLSQEGFGKRSLLEYYRITNRGGKGVKTMNVTEKTGRLVAFKSVNDDNDLVIINKSGITLRIHVASVRVMGRATQGVRIINLDKRNDVIASVCCVDADPEEEVEEIIEGEELPDMIEEPIVNEDAEVEETEDDTNEETEE
jgi:DNA gyrase subunit A